MQKRYFIYGGLTRSSAEVETPLLQTKFYIPPSRPDLVLRLRLIERLNQGLQVPLTLITTPAGLGKATCRPGRPVYTLVGCYSLIYFLAVWRSCATICVIAVTAASG